MLQETKRSEFIATFGHTVSLIRKKALTPAPPCISYYKQNKLYRLVYDDSRQLEWAHQPTGPGSRFTIRCTQPRQLCNVLLGAGDKHIH